MFMHSYTGATKWESEFKIFQMSTINQVTKDYPSTYLSVGDADPFYSQNIEFYRKLKEEGIPVSTLFYDGSHHLHHQYQFHLEKPESKENMKRVLAFLSRNTSSSGVEQNQQSPFDGSTSSIKVSHYHLTNHDEMIQLSNFISYNTIVKNKRLISYMLNH